MEKTEKKRILIVEDEGIVSMEIMSDLEGLGYAADTCGSGEEALECIQRSPPDLVVMDIRLHGRMDGMETAEAIRKVFDIPVIYLSAHTDESTLERAKATGPYSYLMKPFKLNELHLAVDIALCRHKMEKEKERLLRELREALALVKQLSGILSICSYCKKVKDDKGAWKNLETYIAQHSEALFSHGICPGCCEKVRQEADRECAELIAGKPR